MSILIRGIEMPTSCEDCPLENCDENYYGDESNHRCSLIYKGYTSDNRYEKRRNDCPLVPIPPHGRLIDEEWLKDAMITTLEALKKNPKMDRQEMHLIAAIDTLRAMIEDAPTIIEAEVKA